MDETTKHQIIAYHDNKADLIKWFIKGDMEQHVASYQNDSDIFPQGLLILFEKICNIQGVPNLFAKLLIKHYARSNTYVSARNRFDNVIEPHLDAFSGVDFIELIDTINQNRQIYEYAGQISRNNIIIEKANEKLPKTFDFSKYIHFEFTQPTEAVDSENTLPADLQDDNDIDSE